MYVRLTSIYFQSPGVSKLPGLFTRNVAQQTKYNDWSKNYNKVVLTDFNSLMTEAVII